MSELTTFEAAQEFKANPVVLLRLIAQGRLQARRDEFGKWRINRRSMESWNKARMERRRVIEENTRERQREEVSA
jgi:predicted site-specific integrase-resolvase